MITLDLGKLRESVMLTTTFRAWGNKRKADISAVKTESDKRRLTLSKTLIVCDEYDGITSYQNQVRDRVERQTVPAFIKKGFYMVKAGGVPKIERELMNARDIVLPMMLGELKQVYPQKVREAEKALGDQFNQADYPTVDELTNLFDIEWNWVAFGVPEGLPEELRATEAAKMEAKFKEAGDQITLALRSGFKDLVAKMAERLQPGPDGKPKTFRDTLVGNLVEFIETFNNRNLMDDADLEALVGRARDLLKEVGSDVTKGAQVLRDNEALRTDLANSFATLTDAASGMIETERTRKITLE